jgi:transposase
MTEQAGPRRRRFSAEVAPGRHAALLVDQAGWHLSARLAVPDNVTIVPLPAKCPELNPQENVWQFMRDNGSPTACSRPTTPSSTNAATPGTSSQTNLDHHVDQPARLGAPVLI